jgi:hypothetical protein
MTVESATLTMVNAPHSQKLDGQALATCLSSPHVAKSHPGHMSVFFGEVDPASQKAFAALFGIDEGALAAAASAFAAYSGESYPLAK